MQGGRRSAGAGRNATSDVGPQQEQLRAEVRSPRLGFRFRGRNPNPGFRMYTGTLIKDLMMTVERAERLIRLRQITEERELQRLFELQGPATQSGVLLGGAG